MLALASIRSHGRCLFQTSDLSKYNFYGGDSEEGLT